MITPFKQIIRLTPYYKPWCCAQKVSSTWKLNSLKRATNSILCIPLRQASLNDKTQNFSRQSERKFRRGPWLHVLLCSTAIIFAYEIYRRWTKPGFSRINFNFFTLKAAEKLGSSSSSTTTNADDNKKSEDNPRKVLNFIADMVEKVAPTVVSIKSEGITQTIFGPTESRGDGSGFIVRSDGLILTNAHVVQGFSRLVVTLQDGRQFDGVVEHYDSSSDLATVRIKAKNLPVMKLADSRKARPGEFVIAMGCPLSFNNTVTHGVISNVRRQLDLENHNIELPPAQYNGILRGKNMYYIQTDAPITFGNSGGPLINLDGEAVGINNMTVGGVSGISFAIPSDYAITFLAEIEKNGNKKSFQPLFKRKRLGITMLTLDPEIIRELRFWNSNFPNIDHGILVHTVEPKSAAQQAGIRPGDIITHVDREAVFTPEQITEKLRKTSSLTLTILRNSQIENLSVEFD